MAATTSGMARRRYCASSACSRSTPPRDRKGRRSIGFFEDVTGKSRVWKWAIPAAPAASSARRCDPIAAGGWRGAVGNRLLPGVGRRVGDRLAAACRLQALDRPHDPPDDRENDADHPDQHEDQDAGHDHEHEPDRRLPELVLVVTGPYLAAGRPIEQRHDETDDDRHPAEGRYQPGDVANVDQNHVVAAG